VQGLLVGADPFFNGRREQLVTLAAHYAIPAIYELREYAMAGGLMSYGKRYTHQARKNVRKKGWAGMGDWLGKNGSGKPNTP
jgi:hypothetical protein